MNKNKLLQEIANEIRGIDEKFVYNTVSIDDVNNNISDLNENMKSVISILKEIRDSLNN